MESWNEIRKVAHVSVYRFTVSEIMFNHDSQSSTSDGLNLLRRYGAGMQIGITAGEWRNGGDMNDPVCYTGGITPTVKVKFRVSPQLSSACISADTVGTESPLGGLAGQPVAFSVGQSQWVKFTADSVVSNIVRKADHRWEWKVS